MPNSHLHSDITAKIIRAFFNVYNKLGYVFLEKVYKNALVIELNKLGLLVVAEQIIEVFYEGKRVGIYFADLIVNDLVIIEVKACENLNREHEYQLLNYLKATNKEVGLLLNFGKTAEFRRKVFSKEYKTNIG